MNLDGYERMVELAEARLELAERGHFAEVAAIGARQQELATSLPAPAPAEARPLLERLEVLRRHTLHLAETAIQRTGRELAALRRNRPKLLAYVGAPERRSLDRHG